MFKQGIFSNSVYALRCFTCNNDPNSTDITCGDAYLKPEAHIENCTSEQSWCAVSRLWEPIYLYEN